MLLELTKEQIKNLFSKTVYQRGFKYYQQKRVTDLFYDEDSFLWEASVVGSEVYHVEISDMDPTSVEIFCDCPAFDTAPCKHLAAVLLEILDYGEAGRRFRSQDEESGLEEYITGDLVGEVVAWHQDSALEKDSQKRLALKSKQLMEELIQSYSFHTTAAAEPLKVQWILRVKDPYIFSNPIVTIEIKVGPKRVYVVKEIKEFLRAVARKEPYFFTGKYTYEPGKEYFAPSDLEMIQLLQEGVKYEDAYKEVLNLTFNHDEPLRGRELLVPPMIFSKLLQRLKERDLYFEVDDQTYRKIEVTESSPPLSFQLDKKTGEKFQLDLTELERIKSLPLFGHVLMDNHFYQLTEEQGELIQHFENMMFHLNSTVLSIEDEMIEPFMSNIIPRVKKIAKVEIDEEITSIIENSVLQVKVYVDKEGDLLQSSIEYHYGQHQINPFEQENDSIEKVIILRDEEKEMDVMSVIKASLLQKDGERLYVEGESDIYEFLYKTLPQLELVAEVYLTHSVRSLLLSENQMPTTKIDVQSSSQLLEVHFDMKGIETQEVNQILQSVLEKKKYYRLPNGAFVPIEGEGFEQINKMFSELNIKTSQLNEDKVQLPTYRGLQLEDVISHNNKRRVKYGKQFRQFINGMKNPEELDFELPNLLQAELRDYQKEGFHWLKMLSYYQLGGILADDMGLGKTLQSIAFLLSEKMGNEKWNPALIVAPASLVYNWKNEFKKFAPSLNVDVLMGNPQERVEKLQNEKEQDVWITSYHTLRQDQEAYQKLNFSVLILDEAQTVKNYTTKSAKAVSQIKARTRFALSGTPIENSIDELWSIFQVIIPDFFPNLKQFRQLEPEKVAKMIRPFLLRRVKSDVLKELPEKIETIHYSELLGPQKKLYLNYLERIKQESMESIQEEGFQKSRIKILAGLTRLRQLCCHPSLFLDDYKGESGKLQQLIEVVQNAKENGRRMIIFSQFTEMLSIIRGKLTKAGFDYYYLDGQTPAEKRVDMVEEFNHGEKDAFLISLKAGNTGLNLTGADTVILFDLWWNPAVEEQAAGRAHRIGQKKVVQVIRLITQGTIEEKIFELQQSKKELIEAVIDSKGPSASSSLSEQDIKEILNI